MSNNREVVIEDPPKALTHVTGINTRTGKWYRFYRLDDDMPMDCCAIHAVGGFDSGNCTARALKAIRKDVSSGNSVRAEAEESYKCGWDNYSPPVVSELSLLVAAASNREVFSKMLELTALIIQSPILTGAISREENSCGFYDTFCDNYRRNPDPDLSIIKATNHNGNHIAVFTYARRGGWYGSIHLERKLENGGTILDRDEFWLAELTT